MCSRLPPVRRLDSDWSGTSSRWAGTRTERQLSPGCVVNERSDHPVPYVDWPWRFNPAEDPRTFRQFHRGHGVGKWSRVPGRDRDVRRDVRIDDPAASRLSHVERCASAPWARRQKGKPTAAALSATLEQEPVSPQSLPPLRALTIRLGRDTGYGFFLIGHCINDRESAASACRGRPAGLREHLLR
jgi:hypothetical protein